MEPQYNLLPIAELHGHTACVWNVAWNPSRPLLASCSADKSVRLYHYRHDDDTVRFAHISSIPTGHSKSVRSITWAPSGKTLVTASFDSHIGMWEQEGATGEEGGSGGEWECMSLLEGHESECKSVAYSSGGNLLASCGRDKTVWIWEVHPDSDFECMAVLMEHTQDVKCVAWHPTQEILASASYDDTIKLYVDDPSDDWFCFDTLKGHTSTVWSISFSPTGSYLASASDDRSIRIWSPSTSQTNKWEQVHVINNAHERCIYSLSWGGTIDNEDKEEGNLGWLASTGGDGVIRVWSVCESPTQPDMPSSARLSTVLLVHHPNAHGEHDINVVSWCPREDGRGMLASGGDDESVRIWRIAKRLEQ